MPEMTWFLLQKTWPHPKPVYIHYPRVAMNKLMTFDFLLATQGIVYVSANTSCYTYINTAVKKTNF